jgi:hypothetical protein
MNAESNIGIHNIITFQILIDYVSGMVVQRNIYGKVCRKLYAVAGNPVSNGNAGTAASQRGHEIDKSAGFNRRRTLRRIQSRKYSQFGIRTGKNIVGKHIYAHPLQRSCCGMVINSGKTLLRIRKCARRKQHEQ